METSPPSSSPTGRVTKEEPDSEYSDRESEDAELAVNPVKRYTYILVTISKSVTILISNLEMFTDR